MLPTLRSGDLVIYKPIKPGGTKPTPGSIGVIKDPINTSSLIVKRIHKTHSQGIELRGDNETMSSDSRQFGIVNINNLCGIVEGII